MLKLTILLITIIVKHAHSTPLIVEEKNLFQTLADKGTVNILLSMTQGSTSEALNSIKDRSYSSRAEQLNTVAQVLKSQANGSQKELLNFLSMEQKLFGKISFKQLWITNQIMLKGANASLLQKLLGRTDISKIEQEIMIPRDQLFDGKLTQNPKPVFTKEDLGWGVIAIEAPAVWATGNRGQNVTVAVIDGGILYTHEALKDNWRSDYGFYDIEFGTEWPTDDDGHGTHTLGTILGQTNNIGIAPLAQWITCKMCFTNENCSNWGLAECGQWLACPTKFDGSDPDCSKAPHVISNSCGFDQENYWYNDIINVWHAGGIIPIFAQGNSGPSCGSTHSPGDYPNVIGVGSTMRGDIPSNTTSVGPTFMELRMKPDMVAPGDDIVSADWKSDTGYASRSGTSMAAPHVTGLVTLLLSAKPDLTYEEIKYLLQSGAVPTANTGRDCGGVSEDIYPNHVVGYGRIDAVNSIENLGKL